MMQNNKVENLENFPGVEGPRVSSSDARVIGTNIADLLKKALLEAHKQLVEDGFVSAG